MFATIFEAYQSRESLVNIDVGAATIGLATAFIAASIAIKWLVAYLSKHGLALFGWYRIALAILVAIGLWSGYLSLTGKSNEKVFDGGSATSSAANSLILKKDQFPELLVATHATPSITTGPATVCQFPDFTT